MGGESGFARRLARLWALELVRGDTIYCVST